MRVLLCGEGPHDIGTIENWSIRANKQVVEAGWLQPIIEKSLKNDIEFVIVPKNRLVSLPNGKNGKKPLPKGHGAKAMLAKFRAASDKCDAVIFVIDADSCDKKCQSSKMEQIELGFEAYKSDIVCIGCVPMSASESWLLADDAVWRSMGLQNKDALPKNPENIWGDRKDPESQHPKQYFARICKVAQVGDDRQTRKEISEALSLDKLSVNCPHSAGPFLESLAILSK